MQNLKIATKTLLQTMCKTTVGANIPTAFTRYC